MDRPTNEEINMPSRGLRWQPLACCPAKNKPFGGKTIWREHLPACRRLQSCKTNDTQKDAHSPLIWGGVRVGNPVVPGTHYNGVSEQWAVLCFMLLYRHATLLPMAITSSSYYPTATASSTPHQTTLRPELPGACLQISRCSCSGTRCYGNPMRFPGYRRVGP